MGDEDKTKEELIKELEDLRNLNRKLESLESDRKRTSELLEKIFLNVYVLIAYLDSEFNFIRVNKAYAEADGRPPEFFIGKNHFTIFPYKDNEVIFRRVVETGEPYFAYAKPFEYAEHPERGVTYWDWSLIPIKDETGKVNSLLFTLLNVTDHKRAELALKHRENELFINYQSQMAINDMLRILLEDIPLENILQYALDTMLFIPWLTVEKKGAIFIIEDNPAVLKLKAHRGMDDAMLKKCSSVPFGVCLCGRTAATKKVEFSLCTDVHHDVIYEGMKPHGHYCIPIISGENLLGVISIYLKKDHVRNKKEDELFAAIAKILAGIIKRKKVEKEKDMLGRQLYHSQKMESLGTLAGGIAHDFNNILTALMGYAHIMQMKMDRSDPLRTYTTQILAAGERAANLTSRILTFSRKQAISPKPVKINELIKNIEKFLIRLIDEDIEMKIMLSDADLTAMADSAQIEQVLINLATNARDAMPDGGALNISTEPVEFGEAFIKAHGYGQAGKYVLITVADTGIGMDEKTRERIFEPFFTTKEVGKGTGLGLAIVYGIIKQHNGYINCYSEPDKGTIFRIYLPVTEPAEIKESEISVVPSRERGTETILIAEDEAPVREYLKELLEEFGYTVIEAADGEDAVKKFYENKNRVNLLILDVIMPKKNGRDVYEEIGKKRKAVKVLFMSGYTADIIHKKGIIEDGFSFISKPVSPHEFLSKIRELLDS